MRPPTTEDKQVLERIAAAGRGFEGRRLMLVSVRVQHWLDDTVLLCIDHGDGTAEPVAEIFGPRLSALDYLRPDEDYCEVHDGPGPNVRSTEGFDPTGPVPVCEDCVLRQQERKLEAQIAAVEADREVPR